MKKNIFITTSITIFLVQLLVFPFALTASAVESGSALVQSAEISLVEFGGEPVVYPMQVYPFDDVPADSSVAGSFSSFNNTTVQMDTVLGFNKQINSGANARGWIHLDYGVSSFKDFNQVEFVGYVWCEPTGYPEDPNDYFRIVFNNELATKGVTITNSVSSIDTTTTPFGNTVYFRTVAVRVYFNEPYKYDTLDVDLYLRTYLPPLGFKCRYLVCVDDLKFSYATQEEFVANISAGISKIENKIDTTNEKLTIVGDSIDDIKTLLETGMSEEQAEKITEGRSELEENSIKVQTQKEHIESLDNELNVYFQSYEDIEYDIFGDRYTEYADLYVEPVLENSGFSAFWNGFFSHDFVVAMIITSLTFCAVGFAMYGVR